MEILLMICCLIIVGLCATPILSAIEYEPVPEEYPIKYPIGDDPKIEKDDILDDILNCDDQTSLNWAYLRIQIYTGDYPKQKKFIDELIDSYKTKERLINSNIE